MNLLFVIPVFNDWPSFWRLITEIDRVLSESDHQVSIMAVDDGSPQLPDLHGGQSLSFQNIAQIEIAHLECNLGHQRAIAVGLSIAAKRQGFDAVVVMDCDGEDKPQELPRILNAYRENSSSIIMAHRAKRSEGRVFKIFYSAYKSSFLYLTGLRLSFGNYCILPPAAVRRLAFMPDLWNSLPASCLRSRLPMVLVPTVRGNRYGGESRMGFVGLILHGLQAIAVFSDFVLTRLSLAAILIAILFVTGVVFLRLIDVYWMIPGWASYMVSFVFLALLMILLSLFATMLLTLQERRNTPFIPYAHADIYVRNIQKVFP